MESNADEGRARDGEEFAVPSVNRQGTMLQPVG